MTKSKKITRRRAVTLGLGAFTSAGAWRALSQLTEYNQGARLLAQNQTRDFAVIGNSTLKERAAAKRLLYGGASNYKVLTSDKKFADIFQQECAVLIVEEDLMWSAIRPQAETFAFAKGDWLADFARTHSMLLGANLIWHNYMPKWFEETFNKQNAQKILLEHIEKVTGHYIGKIQLWSVVNEAIFPKDGRSDGLRSSQWLEALGPDYIEMSFRAAARADPNALLLYNEYGLEFDAPDDEARRTAVLKLLERLKSRGTPIHALGIQAHILAQVMSDRRFNPKKMQAFLRDVANLDLKILISEMDVIDKDLPKNVRTRDRMVAQVYEDYLSIALAEPAVMGVITWGLSDRYTWLFWNEPRSDGAPVRPLPYSGNFKRKLAWNAVARAFDKAAIR